MIRRQKDTVKVIPPVVVSLYSFLYSYNHPGPGCSKLTTSLVNVSLKFQTLISHITIRKEFFQQKISVYLVIKS